MNTTTLILIATFIVVAVTIIPTYIKSRKAKTSEEDWAVANRSLPIYVVVGTQFASAMGGGILVGHVTNAYRNGIGVLTYGILSLLVFLVLMVIGKWLRRNNFSTVPEILKRFTNNSKPATIVAAIMTIFVPFGWVTSQITAFGSIYSQITGLNYNMLCVVFCAISLLFIMPSGLKTVAWTDFFFSCFMIFMCVVTVFKVTGMSGGLANIAVNIDDPALLSFAGSVNKIGPMTVFLWIFAVLPGGMTNQIYFQRICAIDSEKKVNTSLLLSGILTTVAFGWSVYMGLNIRSINPNIEGGAATGWFMNQLSPILLALFAALIFATLMSTLSSGVQSTVVNVTRDIVGSLKPEYPEKKMLRLSRILSLVVILVALLMCLVFTDTLGWLVNTYSASAATLLCPIYVGFALRKKNFLTTPGLIASMIVGAASCFIAMGLKSAIPPVVIGIACSFIALVGVSALTKKTLVATEKQFD